jgi:hypothetical protein
MVNFDSNYSCLGRKRSLHKFSIKIAENSHHNIDPWIFSGWYHLSCGMDNGTYQDDETKKSFCHRHLPSSQLRRTGSAKAAPRRDNSSSHNGSSNHNGKEVSGKSELKINVNQSVQRE